MCVWMHTRESRYYDVQTRVHDGPLFTDAPTRIFHILMLHVKRSLLDSPGRYTTYIEFTCIKPHFYNSTTLHSLPHCSSSSLTSPTSDRCSFTTHVLWMYIRLRRCIRVWCCASSRVPLYSTSSSSDTL